VKTSKEKIVTIHVPVNGNELLKTTIAKVNENEEVYALWKVINVNAIDRLGMSDHGPVHFQIVANIALRMTRILVKNKVTLGVVSDFDLTNEHAEVIVFLASILHDLGMSISREGHEEFSLFLANNLLHQILEFMPVEERTIVISEVLHTIISHRKNGRPSTVEAGIVRVADALDMSEGRSRVPFTSGKIDIYSISAAAIDAIEIKEGEKCPVQVNIIMNNSAGIFQVDELLKSKLRESRIEKYVAIRAYVRQDSEKKLVKEYMIKNA
jgi:uncharacterized protein